MYLGMGGHQRQEMRISPSLIQYTQILQLSGPELRDIIMQELEENPALRLVERPICPACGDPLRPDGLCYRCRRGEHLERAEARSLIEADDPDEAYDALMAVPDQASLEEHLLFELGAVLNRDDMGIAEFLVGELNERGFLETPLDLVAQSLAVPLQQVEAVLEALQQVGPLGIGARSVTECLTIQLSRLEEQMGPLPLVRQLILEGLEDLAAGRYTQLARRFGVEQADVIEARNLIRDHLRPYPITEDIDLDIWERGSTMGVAAPDVIIRPGKDGESFLIEVVESRRLQLSINPLYDDLASSPQGPGQSRRGLSAQEQRQIQEQVKRAQNFLGFVQERRNTLERVTVYVAARQASFLLEGPRGLCPLTRAEVAEALGLHESTISRATKDKFVMLPNHRVVPYGMFFQAALSAQDALRALVEGEPHPYTDSELADLLAAQGHPMSRRTVTKYRRHMGILPSHLR
mgnify:FL=1